MVMMAPASVIEYLFMNELSYFLYRWHSTEFWNGVNKILPDYQKQFVWLREYRVALDI
jgi:predicted metal-dependent hydrolase